MKKRMFYKKISFIAFLILLAFLNMSCSENSKSDKAVRNYFNSLYEFDMKKMSEAIEPRQLDQFDEVIGTEFEDGSIEAILVKFINEQSKDLTFTINESAVNVDYGIASVECTYIDWGKGFDIILELLNNQILLSVLTSPESLTDDDVPKILKIILHIKEDDDDSLMGGEKVDGAETIQVGKPLEFPTATEEIKVKTILADDDWYVKSMNPDSINASWLELKSFSQEIKNAVSNMRYQGNL